MVGLLVLSGKLTASVSLENEMNHCLFAMLLILRKKETKPLNMKFEINFSIVEKKIKNSFSKFE